MPISLAASMSYLGQLEPYQVREHTYKAADYWYNETNLG
jgi:hypothetical protein